MRMLEQILTSDNPLECNIGEFRHLLEDAEIFDITNVAEYLFAQTDQEVWDIAKDFPCLAPPFPNIWMEYARPSRILSRECGTRTTENFAYRCGLFFDFQDLQGDHSKLIDPEYIAQVNRQITDTLNREFTPEIQQELTSMCESGLNFADIQDRRWDKLSPKAQAMRSLMLQYAVFEQFEKEGTGRAFAMMTDKGGRWIGNCSIFLQDERNGPVYGPLGKRSILLNAQGDVIESSMQTNLRFRDREWNTSGDMSAITFPGLLAISFCHCKNVLIEAETIPPRLAKRQRERGRPGFVFKRLEITPMKAVLAKAGAGSHNGLQKALHICRGHFKDYREHGLFGKRKGLYWWDMHARGTIKQGMVVKDYKILSPGGVQ